MADREKKRGRRKYKNLDISRISQGLPFGEKKNLIKKSGHKPETCNFLKFKLKMIDTYI